MKVWTCVCVWKEGVVDYFSFKTLCVWASVLWDHHTALTYTAQAWRGMFYAKTKQKKRNK